MTEQKKLRELQNDIRIVGTLKEINLEVKPNKTDPKVKQIMGNIVVVVTEKSTNRIHEHTINIFAKDSSKLYKGYVTIMNEAKAADVVGLANADRVSITGSIDENMYMGNGELKQFNRNRGLFINRLDEVAVSKDPSLANDTALAQLEVVVTGIVPKTDNDGVETGEYTIKAFTVGYNNGVHALHGLVVGADLADVITEHYEAGSTGKLTFAINNYVELEEQVEEDPFANAGDGFGVQVDISNGPVKKYVRELRVIGGFPPHLDEKALDEDDIKLANQIHALKLQETKNSVPATPPVQSGGFGVASQDPFGSGSKTIDIKDDDLPF